MCVPWIYFEKICQQFQENVYPTFSNWISEITIFPNTINVALDVIIRVESYQTFISEAFSTAFSEFCLFTIAIKGDPKNSSRFSTEVSKCKVTMKTMSL